MVPACQNLAVKLLLAAQNQWRSRPSTASAVHASTSAPSTEKSRGRSSRLLLPARPGSVHVTGVCFRLYFCQREDDACARAALNQVNSPLLATPLTLAILQRDKASGADNLHSLPELSGQPQLTAIHRLCAVNVLLSYGADAHTSWRIDRLELEAQKRIQHKLHTTMMLLTLTLQNLKGDLLPIHLASLALDAGMFASLSNTGCSSTIGLVRSVASSCLLYKPVQSMHYGSAAALCMHHNS